MKKYSELKDRVVLITGGTQGIGEAMADAYTAQGCKVAINGRVLNEKVKKVVDRTGAYPAMGDIGDPAVPPRIVKETIEQYGGIDVLIANATAMTMEPFLEQDEKDWWDQINIHLDGHYLAIQEALPHMLKQKRGTLIFISSWFGILGWKNATGYNSTKTGVLALGQHITRYYEKYNINACIIAPGVIRTPQLQVDADDMGLSFDDMCRVYAEDTPAKRIGEPEEIASMAVFMSTEVGGRALRGRHVQVTGGECRITPYYL